MTCEQESIAPLKQVALNPTVHGDTWGGIPQIQVKINGAPPPSALVALNMHFRKSWSDFVPAFKLSTSPGPGEGTITIGDAAKWIASIGSQALPLEPGVWLFDLQFTAADGSLFTPVGGTLAVVKDITRA